MAYQHTIEGHVSALPLGKVLCVGRNYADHAKELNNPVPTSPILFIKPATAVVPLSGDITIPTDQGECHHELEMSVLITQPLSKATEEQVKEAIGGFGLGLDLTLRDLQSKLKEKSHPWEIAKSFDGACPLSEFIAPEKITDPENVDLQLSINGSVRQQGNTGDMITPVFKLIAYMSQYFTLQPGDVVLTGTPAGVSALKQGDELLLELADQLRVEARVC